MLDAPLGDINVHVYEGNILAMQGEAITTKAARRTPFELLVVLSNGGENSSGEVFLDDGEEVEMGGEGGMWSLVRFQGRFIRRKAIIIESEVVNGEYALTQNWVICKVTILGVKNVSLKGYDLYSRMGMFKKLGVRKSLVKGEGEFVIVEISGLSLLLGEEFKLELKLN